MGTSEDPIRKSSATPGILTEPGRTGVPQAAPGARIPAIQRCEDCRVGNSFQAWERSDLAPMWNTVIDFSNWGLPSPGKRAVIELVTAQIVVPPRERARLRMRTSLNGVPSYIDLALTPQGIYGDQYMLVATHAIRAYSDQMIQFDVGRDNDQTRGLAEIGICGYLVDI